MEHIQRAGTGNLNRQAPESSADGNSAVLRLDYYTDPLCCWSWALEPQLRRLRYCFGDAIVWRNVMTGLIPDWQSYSDPMNSVGRPVQMGAVWKEAGHVSGMPVNDRLWVDDPPASSYPACLAVKTAELQGQLPGELYLRKAREAVMTRALNISKKEMLLQVADELAADSSCFSFGAFKKDFLKRTALEEFRKDLRQAKEKSITRYPTIVVYGKGRKGLVMTGYRPYQSLVDALLHVAPDIEPVYGVELEDYRRYWGNLTERELEEITSGRTLRTESA